MIRVWERTVPRLTPGATSRSGKPTSKNQPARSIRTLSRYKAVIPAVTFRSPLPRTPHAPTADPWPAFQPATVSVARHVKRAFARTRYAPVPAPLRSPLGALATLSKACRPSETARLPCSTTSTPTGSGAIAKEGRTQCGKCLIGARRHPKRAATGSSLPCTHHAARRTNCCQARTGLLAP